MVDDEALDEVGETLPPGSHALFTARAAAAAAEGMAAVVVVERAVGDGNAAPDAIASLCTK